MPRPTRSVERRRAVQAAAAVEPADDASSGRGWHSGVCWVCLADRRHPAGGRGGLRRRQGPTGLERRLLHPADDPRRGRRAAACGTPSSAPSSSRRSPSPSPYRWVSCAGCSWPSRDGRVAAALRFTADVMTGHPVHHRRHLRVHRHRPELQAYSGFAGAFAIGFIMLPVIIRAGETAFRGVPRLAQRGGHGPRCPAGHRGPHGGGPHRPARGHHRRTAGRGPWPRRDGPAAVDHPRQRVPPVEPVQADGGASHPHLQQQQPALRRPGPGGLGRGTAADGGGAGPQHRQPPAGRPPRERSDDDRRRLRLTDPDVEESLTVHADDGPDRPTDRRSGHDAARRGRGLRRSHRGPRRHLRRARGRGHRPHRPVRLGQDDAAAGAQPHARHACARPR